MRTFYHFGRCQSERIVLHSDAPRSLCALLLPFLPLLLTALTLSPSAAAGEESAALCPAQIETEQSIVAPVAGYEAVDAIGKHFWDTVIFYEGRPELMVSLHPDSDVDTPDHGSVATWKLDPKAEYWIECQYSATSIVLRKKLPPVGQCEASYRWQTLEEVVCR